MSVTKQKTQSMLILSLLLLFGVVSGAHAQQQKEQVDPGSYIEAVRADIRAQRIAAIASNMHFSEEESKMFWPVYRKYESAIVALYDERVERARRYSQQSTTVTDAEATEMMDQELSFESRRLTIKKQYLAEFRKVGLRPVTVAKFMDLDEQMDSVIEAKLAGGIPRPASSQQQLSVGQEN